MLRRFTQLLVLQRGETLTLRVAARIYLLGGLLCAIVSPIFGTILMALPTVRTANDLALIFLSAVMFFVYAEYAAAPFGFIVGGIGTVYLAYRAARVSRFRLLVESCLLGTLLGAIYPVVANLYLFPNEYLDSVMKSQYLSNVGSAAGALYAVSITVTLWQVSRSVNTKLEPQAGSESS